MMVRFSRILTSKRHALALYAERLKGLSPLEKLTSGYSYVEDEEGRNVRSVSQVEEGDQLKLHFSDGSADVRVLGKAQDLRFSQADGR